MGSIDDNKNQDKIKVLITDCWNDYELVDSGNKRKLERFGRILLVRPEEQAMWKPRLPEGRWQEADGELNAQSGRRGEWKLKEDLPQKWNIRFQDGTTRLWLKFTKFGHIGFFPEQAAQWMWIRQKIELSQKPLKVLNLFGYTGIGSIIAAKAGAHVTHVDASRPAVAWGGENQIISNAGSLPIRWIIDDALKFVKREERRGNKYNGIIMDPPRFGRGPSGQIWRFEDSFIMLLDACKAILDENPQFFVVTAYSMPLSSISLSNVLMNYLDMNTGFVEHGEHALLESNSDRLLSTSIYARWFRK